MKEDSLIGQQLANFRIDHLLGQGGMARVYRGWDVKLERPVAIKMIAPQYQHKKAYAERFIKESKAVAKWRHENIIQVYYASDEGDFPYFVMEYIEGESLKQKLANATEALPASEVLTIGRALASALDYAHQKEIIHRDVKPSNVMIDQEGRVVLMDFGLAFSQTDDNVTDSRRESIGSVYYMAPEQVQSSKETVFQSDLYALAVVLYEMLVGRLPFDDPSSTSVALQHIKKEPPKPSDFNPALPPATDNVFHKALSKEPHDRYANAQQFLDALEKALQETSISTDNLIGHQLDEYRLEEFLGHGGMGRIYRGYDERLARHVAIKVIDASNQANADYRERFTREAQAIAQLEHPHIVRLYRYGEVSGLFYMAMQFIEGLNLRDHLATYRRQKEWMPNEEILAIIRQVCLALDYAHSRQIIHRDVKPANIMIHPQGQAFLTDFGLALLTDTHTRGEIFGSPRYLAPEQAISSAGVVPQSDLYAVGVILYEMFTGRVPFDTSDALDLAMMHMSEPPPPPSDFRVDLSGAVEAVILRTLSKEPQDRYATGEELVKALTEALTPAEEPAPVVEEPVPPPPVEATPDPVPVSVETPATESAPSAAPPPVSEEPPPIALPPIPAAVAVQPEPETAPAPILTPPPTKRRRSRWGWLLALLIILVVGIGALWQANLLPASIAGIPLLSPTPAPTATPLPTETPVPPTMTSVAAVAIMPATTDTPTMTASPDFTETPIPATPTSTPSQTPSPIPTLPHTATPSPSQTPTETATPTETPLPTATPLVIVTRSQDNMPMVFMPAATFVMGASETDTNAEEDEYPTHEVSLNSYYIDQHEVTVAQYATFLNDNGGYVNTCLGFTCLSTSFETINSYLTDTSDGYIAREGFEQYPINNVSWFGASAYCTWAGGRLPTEAEWEFAGKGTTNTLYPWGDEEPTPELAIWGARFADLLPVDNLPAGVNHFGIFGMAGGVWEWVSDGYDVAYYADSPTENPTGPTISTQSPRVLRGGGFASLPTELRVTNRDSESPLVRQRPDVGFRCAQDVSE